MRVMNSMRTRWTVGTIAMVVAGSAFLSRAGAQQPREDKPARPSQEARLADACVVEADVAYGEDEKQRLDLYAPRSARQAPVVVYVHGGEWTRGDKADVSFKPKFFNQNGIVFVSINYRLTPAVVHPAHVSDVAAAIRWVHDHVGRFGGDPKKIVLMGHSAGCHLVTLAALDPRYLAKVELRPADLAGVVAWSGGSYDLVQKVDSGGAYADYIRKTFGDSKDAWREASPVAYASEAKDGPAFLLVSIESGNASHQAAERLAALIRDAGGKASSKLLEGRDHFGANHYLGAPDDTTGVIFLQFVNDVTK
jgi:arylformamidase